MRLLGDPNRLLLFAVVLFAVLFLFRGFNQKLYLGDEGIATVDAWRILQGQVPGRDFFEIIPPFSFLPTALAYLLFEPNVLVTRLLAVLYGLLLILGTERLTAQFTKNALSRALVVAVLIPAGVAFWPMPSHHWVVDILQLFALLALLHALRAGGHVAWAMVGGLLCGLAGFTLQDQGSYLSLALLFLFFPLIVDAPIRRRMLLGWIAGLAAVAAAFGLWFLLARVPIPELFYQWVLFPGTRYKDINSSRWSIFAGWELIVWLWRSGRFANNPLYLSSMTLLETLISFLPVLACFAALAAWRNKWAQKSEVALLTAGLIAFLGGAVHRWTLTNIQWALAIPLVFVALAFDRGILNSRVIVRRIAWIFCWALLGSSLVFAALDFGLESLHRTSQIQSPAGSLRTMSKQESSEVQEAIDAIQRLVPPKAPLFIDGYHPLISFLTFHPNPTRYTFFYDPAYNTKSQAEEVIHALQRLTVSYALVAKPLRQDSVMHKFFLGDYKPVWQNARAILFVRDEVRPKAGSPSVPKVQRESGSLPDGSTTAK